MPREMNNLPRSHIFPASGFHKEGFSLKLTFCLYSHGPRQWNGLIRTLGKAIYNDLLCSILLPGSLRKSILFSHWAPSSTLALVTMKVALWLSAALLSSLFNMFRTWMRTRGAVFWKALWRSQRHLGEIRPNHSHLTRGPGDSVLPLRLGKGHSCL